MTRNFNPSVLGLADLASVIACAFGLDVSTLSVTSPYPDCFWSWDGLPTATTETEETFYNAIRGMEVPEVDGNHFATLAPVVSSRDTITGRGVYDAGASAWEELILIRQENWNTQNNNY